MTIFSDILFISPDRVCAGRPLPVLLNSGLVIGACSLIKIDDHVIAVFCIDEKLTTNHPFYYHFLYAGIKERSPLTKIVVEKINDHNQAVWSRN